MADRNTLLPEFALVAKRLPLELSIPPQSFHFPKRRGGEQMCEAARFGRFRHQHQYAQTTKSSHVCPSVGNNTNANVSC